jgi:Ca-activated chloride channel homolog
MVIKGGRQMKRLSVFLLCIAPLMTGGGWATAMSPPKELSIQLHGAINYPYISHHGGTAFLHVTLTSGEYRPATRRPMNISVVLDRSGSMAEEGKMSYAHRALCEMLNHLQKDDLFSLVIYDDVVEAILPSRRVHDPHLLRELIESIHPRGGTNLGAGLQRGIQEVSRHVDYEYINRVILISDGLANRGITDLHHLKRIAHDARRKSVSITTMGVGLSFHEDLMMGLAESGGGTYYFIESGASLPSIMQDEFNTMSHIVAQNAEIELQLGRGVLVQDVVGCLYRTSKGKYIITVGDIYANSQREFVVELSIPPGSGTRRVVRGSLSFKSGEVSIRRVQPFEISLVYTRDAAEVEKHRDHKAQAKADIAVSTRMVDEALKALDEGKREEAEQHIQEAQLFLSTAPTESTQSGAGAAIHQQKERLEEYGRILKENEKERAKKMIQYDNYKGRK